MMLAWAVLAAALGQCPEAEQAGLEGPSAHTRCALAARAAPEAEVNARVLEDILSRPRFAHARQRGGGAWKALVERFKAWFSAFFESSGAQSFSEVLRFVVLTLAGLIGALGILRLLGSWRRTSQGQAQAPDVAPLLLLDAPEEHLARARAALAASPREAIRQGLLALLSALEDARYARPDRVRTNRELVRELPARGAPPAVVARIEPMVRWYDGAFYSLEPVPTEGAARFLDEVAQANAALTGPGR